MPRFDLHRVRGTDGYLLNVQHDLHEMLSTRVVVPVLAEATAPLPSRDLNPRVDIDGQTHIIFPQYLSAMPRHELGRPVGNLEGHRDAITRALDILLTGF